MHVNHYKIIESISEEFLAMKKQALWKSSEYALHMADGGMIVKNKESGVREQKIGRN